MPDFPTADGSLARRRFLAVGLSGAAALALSGCAGGGTVGDPAAADPSEAPASPEVTPSLTPDVTVATAALEQIQGVRQAVEATVVRYPKLGSSLDPVVAMHRAHEATLVDAVPERARTSVAPTPYAVPGKRGVALTRLATAEKRLHSSLDGLGLRAQSGDFARLLAAMGAGIGQRLAGWPE